MSATTEGFARDSWRHCGSPPANTCKYSHNTAAQELRVYNKFGFADSHDWSAVHSPFQEQHGVSSIAISCENYFYWRDEQGRYGTGVETAVDGCGAAATCWWSSSSKKVGSELSPFTQREVL